MNLKFDASIFSGSKPFYFIRHGETAWNRAGLVMGSTDIPLNELGLAQAEMSAGHLVNEPITHIVSSPLERARKTAEIINARLNKPLSFVDELRECHWGMREGKLGGDSVLFNAWLNGENVDEFGLEPCDAFFTRVAHGLNQALMLDGPALIVAHSAVYVAMRRIFGLPQEEKLKNCCPVYCAPPSKNESGWTMRKLAP